MEDTDDAASQADELCALEAIYGEGFVQGDPAAGALSFTLPEAAAQPSLRLIVHLPASYPSRHAPVFEVASDMLSPDVLGGLAAELEGLFLPGEVCLWTWIEHLRERWAELAPQQQPAAAAAAGADADVDAALAAELQAAELLDGGEDGAGQRQRQRGAAPPADEELQRAMEEVAATVVHGEPITERRSTFQAHLAPATSAKHAQALVELLLQDRKIRAATHPAIMAFRIEQPGGTTFLQDCDDDGESAAGGRLLHLLQLADARNVVVVVSRWYGGILLGPSRFALINNAARQLLEQCGYITAGGEGKGGGKARKR